MSAIVSAIMLVAVLQSAPYPHIRALDRFETVEDCQSRIESVKAYELQQKVPESEKISTHLVCLKMSYKSDADGDGPKNPTSQSQLERKYNKNDI